jgi:hypothetical protein
MFGINDSQDTDAQAANTAAGGPPAMPPSPFLDSGADKPAADPAPASAPSLPPNDMPAAPVKEPSGSSGPQNEDALVSIKQQALNNLAPLVNHLEQTPEEKFKTTMMLIQASDNSSLVKEAYEAANQITDEKARAQALLDVVNEINYFTQKEAKS